MFLRAPRTLVSVGPHHSVVRFVHLSVGARVRGQRGDTEWAQGATAVFPPPHPSTHRWQQALLPRRVFWGELNLHLEAYGPAR